MQIRPLARARRQARCWWSEARTCRRHSSARRRTPCAAPRSAPPRSRKRERTGRAWQRTARARLERSSVSGDEPRRARWREEGDLAMEELASQDPNQFTYRYHFVHVHTRMFIKVQFCCLCSNLILNTIRAVQGPGRQKHERRTSRKMRLSSTSHTPGRPRQRSGRTEKACLEKDFCGLSFGELSFVHTWER